ncbi:Hypothetical protein, putative [Bodo saltans]|uniref:Uncharacterized protein n=1 Tax=Bodo saltans TaxID=75058 RepID=A0A0S4KGG3_BODSA|nr:Hypothetical protein, putative [Bodo saltans]|eukprot:CUI14787.1 Hypothetical protein, putative [Bodo saltans]
MLTAFSTIVTPSASFVSTDEEGSGTAHSNESSTIGITLAVPRRVSVDVHHQTQMNTVLPSSSSIGVRAMTPSSAAAGAPRNSLTPVLVGPAIEVEHPSVIDMDQSSPDGAALPSATVVRVASKPGLRISVDTTATTTTATGGAMVSPPGQPPQRLGVAAVAGGSGSQRGGGGGAQQTMASFVFPTSAATSVMEIPSLVIEGEHHHVHHQPGISPTAAQLQQLLLQQVQQQSSAGQHPAPAHYQTSQHLTARGSASGPQRFRRLSSSTTSREAMAAMLSAGVAVGSSPTPPVGRQSYLSPRHGSQSLRSESDVMHTSLSHVSSALTRRSSLSHSDGILTPLAAPQVPVRSASFLNLMMVPIPTDLCEESLLDLLRLPSASPRGSMQSSGDYSGSDVSGTSNSLPRKYSSSVTMAPPMMQVGAQLGVPVASTIRASIPSPNDMAADGGVAQFQRASPQASGRLLQVVNGAGGIASGPSSTLTANLSAQQRRRQNSDSQRSSFSVSSVASSANGSAFFPKSGGGGSSNTTRQLAAEFKVAPIATHRSSFETAELIEDTSMRDDTGGSIHRAGSGLVSRQASAGAGGGTNGESDVGTALTIEEEEEDDDPDDMQHSVELLAEFFLREIASRLALVSAYTDAIAPLMVHHFELMWRSRKTTTVSTVPLGRQSRGVLTSPVRQTQPSQPQQVVPSPQLLEVGKLPPSPESDTNAAPLPPDSPPRSSPPLAASGSSSSPLATTTNSASSGSSANLNRVGRPPSVLMPSPVVEKMATSSSPVATLTTLLHTHSNCPYNTPEIGGSPLAGTGAPTSPSHGAFSMAALVSSSSSVGDAATQSPPLHSSMAPTGSRTHTPTSPITVLPRSAVTDSPQQQQNSSYCSCVAPFEEAMQASFDSAAWWFTESVNIYENILLLPFLRDPVAFPSMYEDQQNELRLKKRSGSSQPSSPQKNQVAATNSPTKQIRTSSSSSLSAGAATAAVHTASSSTTPPLSLQVLFPFDDASWISVVGTLRVGAVVLSTRCFYYGLHVHLLSAFSVQHAPLQTIGSAGGSGAAGGSIRRANSNAGSSRGSVYGGGGAVTGGGGGTGSPQGPPVPSGPINGSFSHNTTRSTSTTHSSQNGGGGGASHHVPPSNTASPTSSSIAGGSDTVPPPPIPSSGGAGGGGGGGGAASPWTWLQQQQQPPQLFAVPSLWTTAMYIVFWNHLPRSVQLLQQQNAHGRIDFFPDVPMAASVSMSFRTAANHSMNLGSPPTGSPPSYGGGLRSWSMPRGSFHTRRESDGTISGLLWQQQQFQQQQQQQQQNNGFAGLAGIPQSSPRSHPSAWVHYHGRLSLSGSSFNQYSQQQQQQQQQQNALTIAASNQLTAFIVNLEQLEGTTRSQLEELCVSMLTGLIDMCLDAAPKPSIVVKSLPTFWSPTHQDSAAVTITAAGSRDSRRGSATSSLHQGGRRASMDVPPIISFEEASSRASSSLVVPPSALAGSMGSTASGGGPPGSDHSDGTQPVTATPHDEEEQWEDDLHHQPKEQHAQSGAAAIDGMLPSEEHPSGVESRGIFQSLLPEDLRPTEAPHRNSPMILPLVSPANSPSAAAVAAAIAAMVTETSGSSFSDPAMCGSADTNPARHQSSMSSNNSDLSLMSPAMRAANSHAVGTTTTQRGVPHLNAPTTLNAYRLSVPNADWVMPSPLASSGGGGQSTTLGGGGMVRSPSQSPSTDMPMTTRTMPMTTTGSSSSLLHYHLFPQTNSPSFNGATVVGPHGIGTCSVIAPASAAGAGGAATFTPVLRSPMTPSKTPQAGGGSYGNSPYSTGLRSSPSRLSVRTQDIHDLVDRQLDLMRRGRGSSDADDAHSFSARDVLQQQSHRLLGSGALPSSFLSTASITGGPGSSIASVADPSMFPTFSRGSVTESSYSTLMDRSQPNSFRLASAQNSSPNKQPQQQHQHRSGGGGASYHRPDSMLQQQHHLRLQSNATNGSSTSQLETIMTSGGSTPYAQRSPHDSDNKDGGAWPPAVFRQGLSGVTGDSPAHHHSTRRVVQITSPNQANGQEASATPTTATSATGGTATTSGGSMHRLRFPSWPSAVVLSSSTSHNLFSQDKESKESRSFTDSSSVEGGGAGGDGGSESMSLRAGQMGIGAEEHEQQGLQQAEVPPQAPPSASPQGFVPTPPSAPLPLSTPLRQVVAKPSSLAAEVVAADPNIPNSSNAPHRVSVTASPLRQHDERFTSPTGYDVYLAATPIQLLQQHNNNTPNVPAGQSSPLRRYDDSTATTGVAATFATTFAGAAAAPRPPSASAVTKNGEIILPKPRPPQEHAYQRSRQGLFNGIDEDAIKHPDEFIAAVFRLRRRLINDVIEAEHEGRDLVRECESAGRHVLTVARHSPQKLQDVALYHFVVGNPWDSGASQESVSRNAVEQTEQRARRDSLELEFQLVCLAQLEEMYRGDVIAEFIHRFVLVRGWYEAIFEGLILAAPVTTTEDVEMTGAVATIAAPVVVSTVQDIVGQHRESGEGGQQQAVVSDGSTSGAGSSPPMLAGENTGGYVSPLLPKESLGEALASQIDESGDHPLHDNHQSPAAADIINALENEQSAEFQYLVEVEAASARNLLLNAQIEFISAARKEQRHSQLRALEDAIHIVVNQTEPTRRREVEKLWRNSRNVETAPFMRERFVLLFTIHTPPERSDDGSVGAQQHTKDDDPQQEHQQPLSLPDAAEVSRNGSPSPSGPMENVADGSIRLERDAAFSTVTEAALPVNPRAPLHLSTIVSPHQPVIVDVSAERFDNAPSGEASSDPYENSSGGGRQMQTTPATNQPPPSLLERYPSGEHDTHTSGGTDEASIEPTADQNVVALAEESPLGPSAAIGGPFPSGGSQAHLNNNNNGASLGQQHHQDSIAYEGSPSRAASFLGIDAFPSTSDGQYTVSRRVSPSVESDGQCTSPLVESKEGEDGGCITPAEKNYHPSGQVPAPHSALVSTNYSHNAGGVGVATTSATAASLLFEKSNIISATTLAPNVTLTRSIPLLGHTLASLVNTTHRFPFDDAWFLLMLEVQKLKSKMVDAFCGPLVVTPSSSRQQRHDEGAAITDVSNAHLHAVAALFSGSLSAEDDELLARYVSTGAYSSTSASPAPPPAPLHPTNSISEDLFFPTKTQLYNPPTPASSPKGAARYGLKGSNMLPLLLDVVMTRRLFVTHVGVEGAGAATVLLRLGGGGAGSDAGNSTSLPQGPGIMLMAQRGASFYLNPTSSSQQSQHREGTSSASPFIERPSPVSPATDSGSVSTQTFHGSLNQQTQASSSNPLASTELQQRHIATSTSANGSPWSLAPHTTTAPPNEASHTTTAPPNEASDELHGAPSSHAAQSTVSLVLFPRHRSNSTTTTTTSAPQASSSSVHRSSLSASSSLALAPSTAAPRVALLSHQDAYLGEWKSGQRHGFGLYEYPSPSSPVPAMTAHNNNAFYLIFADAENPAPVVKDLYLGHWANGKRHGPGYYVRVTQQQQSQQQQSPQQQHRGYQSPLRTPTGGGTPSAATRWITCVIYGEWQQDALQKTTWYGVTESSGPCECV